MRLITGPIETLEKRLVDEIAAAREPDLLTPLAVLIGGTLLRPYLSRRIAKASGGIANVYFLTPADLALVLGERAMWAANRLPLPPLADRILLRRLCSEHDGYFAPVRDTPGLSDAMHRLVRELRGAGYDAPALKRALRGACEVQAKEKALAEIFGSFLRAREDFYGPDDCLLEADPERAPWTQLFVYGIWEAPSALLSLLGELALAMPLTTFLPTTGTYADDAHEELRTWLAEPGLDEIELSPSDQDSTLTTVKQCLFGGGAEELGIDSSIRLASAPDPTREVREVARQCMRWAREGVRFHEMAIAYRTPEPYRATIESVFADADIPVYLHEGRPLSERPLGRRALALLDLFDSDLERRAVIDFVSDLRLPNSTYEEFDRPSATRWDRISRDAGVVRGLDQWHERLASYADEARKSDRDWLRPNADRADALLAFVEDLARRLASQPGVAPWSDHLAYLRDLFARYIEGSDAILDALDGLSRFDALGETADGARCRDTVRAAIENLRSDDVLGQREGAFGLRGVNVLDTNSLRHLGFRAVAIVGLVERSFPPPPRPDPLLLDPERINLNANGRAPVPLRVMGPDSEPLQFALAIGAARERLLATYPRKGAGSGRAQLPSSLFRALAEAALGRPVVAQDVDLLPTDLYTHVRGVRIGAADPADALSEAEYDRTLIQEDVPVGRALLVADTPRIGDALDARAARMGRRLTPHDGVLTESGAAELAKLSLLDRSWGPSGLQTYAGCPQRFFLGSVLGADKAEEPEELIQISALDRGSLIHRILERFLSESPAQGDGLLHGPGEEARLLAIADEEFQASEERGETGFSLLWAYDRTNIREDLIRWLANERKDLRFDELTEGDYEVRFAPWAGGGSEGRLSTDEPIEINLDGATLKVGGKIDRLNWDPERTSFRVIDYKTGRAYEDDSSKLRGGAALQLPLYILAGARALDMPPETGDAEYHYSTRKGQFKVQRFTADDMRERRDDLAAVLERIASGIARGQFQMAPRKERDCEWCDFNRICPSARFWQIDRKQRDSVAKSFAEMREIP